tara:strand:+ start:545 stop:949 length:405 start_codon:yes stop_codon:yes gene_type:complete
MSKLLKHDWDDLEVNWLEEDLQQAIIMRMRQRKDHGQWFRIVGDMNAAKRNKSTGARLKAAGMQTGEPDMRIYVEGGVVCFVELKRTGNKTSEAQDVWHDILTDLGFDVIILTADTPNSAVDAMHDIIDNLMEE